MRLLKSLQAEGRAATPAEQETLSKFVGWGQFPGVFNDYWDTDWKAEREAVRGLLSQEDWDEASASTKNAHYTSPDVVKAHWEMAQKLGYKGGRFLETSAGIGYYLGMMPADLAGRTHATAVEKDPTTGGMLGKLYPAANVSVGKFEEFKSPDNFYDLVASNVPFGGYRVHDPRYNKYKANIHDYFFLKSLDQAKPGGLIMHITSTGTLDKGSDKIREALAEKAELVAAVRFPGGAHAEGAGTAVVTDMLVFRKKDPNMPAVDPAVTPADAQPKGPGFTGTTTDSLGRLYHWVNGKRVPGTDWTKTTTVPDPAGGEPIPVNKYFADRPQHVLGTIDRTGKLYGGEQANVTRAEDYDERLRAFIDGLPGGVLRSDTKAPAERFAPEAMPKPGEAKEGGFTVRGGKLYAVEDGRLVEQEAGGKDLPRVTGMLGVRDAFRALLNEQLVGGDTGLLRARLNETYDAFVAAHGPLNDLANRRAFRTDPDSPVLLALEHYDPETKTATKADAFTRDTVRARKAVTEAGTVHESLGVSLNESGRIDLARMAMLLGTDEADVAAELVEKGLAYHDPQEGWKPADIYLSGNVRRKLLLAKAAAAADPKFKPNVTALEKVQPADVDYEDIEVKLGAAWVPPSDVKDFAAHLLGADPSDFEINHVAVTGEWQANYSSRGKRLAGRQAASEQWGTDRKGFESLLQAALDNRTVSVYDEMADGTRYVNKTATDDANSKIQEIKDAFREWVWEDDARRERLHRYYNDNFNNIKNLRYDGSHLTFPGMNPAIELRQHQKDFVWQVITTGKGLAAHEVGTGKTYTMIAAAMELRRMGLAKKPCLACLKANIGAITDDALKLYPGAKILSTADVTDAASRKKMISQIATGDYDLVLMTHDNLDMLDMKPETVQRYIRDEIDELEAAKLAAFEAGGKKKDNRVVKAMEKAKAKLEATLAESLDAGKKDDAVFFEDLGIDQLFVDESHFYKSLPVYTKQDRLKGVPTSRSDRATAMQMRTRWLQAQNGGRGVVFATGTPVANTMAELYNVQRYLQPEDMKERGMFAFDAWASAFGDVQTKMEFTVSGEYKPVSRFGKFTNIPELMAVARQVMDVRRADDMTNADGTPAVVRPNRHDKVVVAPKGPAMEELMGELRQRAEALKGQRPGEGTDNMLSICEDGRKGAMDMRLLNPDAEDDPASKTNQAVNKVLELHRQRPGQTQLIFSNVGVNPGKSGFRVYGDIIDKLVEGGIPRKAIADFSKLEGAKKEAAVEAMRRGEVVVGIGSTEKLGTGVNVQEKVMAMHHLDVPYQPAAVEQRDGRGWRQGNENKDVDVFRYVSEGSLDQTFWQIIGNKTNFIKQVMTPAEKATARVAREEDTEELTPDQLMAAASGDPRVLEKVNLAEEVKQLKAAQSRHEREQLRFRQSVKAGEGKVPHLEGHLEAMRQDERRLADNPDFSLTVDGKTYTDRKEAAAAFDKKVEGIGHAAYSPQEVGVFRGLPVLSYKGQTYLAGADAIKRTSTGYSYYPADEGTKYVTGPSLGSVEAVARNQPRRVKDAQEGLAAHLADVEKSRAGIGKAFPKAEELNTKGERLRQLELELSGKGQEPGETGAPATPERAAEYRAVVNSPSGRGTVAGYAVARAGPGRLVAAVGGKMVQGTPADIDRAIEEHAKTASSAVDKPGGGGTMPANTERVKRNHLGELQRLAKTQARSPEQTARVDAVVAALSANADPEFWLEAQDLTPVDLFRREDSRLRAAT